MRTIQILSVAVAIFSASEIAAGADFEVAIRAHARRVIFGDPIYIEMEIVNRGKEAVLAPPADLALNTFGFTVYDPQTELSIRAGGGGAGVVGGADPIRYEPGKAVKHYWYFFLPGLLRFDHPFWKPIRSGQTIDISGAYAPRRGVAVFSNSLNIGLDSRDDAELRTLEELARPETVVAVRGPTPGDLGFQSRQLLNKEQTLKLAAKVKTGELADLLQLTIRLQELYALPREGDRGVANRALAAWLQEQPDIKRQALINQVQSIAESYNMTTTVKMLESLRERE